MLGQYPTSNPGSQYYSHIRDNMAQGGMAATIGQQRIDRSEFRRNEAGMSPEAWQAKRDTMWNAGHPNNGNHYGQQMQQPGQDMMGWQGQQAQQQGGNPFAFGLMQAIRRLKHGPAPVPPLNTTNR